MKTNTIITLLLISCLLIGISGCQNNEDLRNVQNNQYDRINRLETENHRNISTIQRLENELTIERSRINDLAEKVAINEISVKQQIVQERRTTLLQTKEVVDELFPILKQISEKIKEQGQMNEKDVLDLKDYIIELEDKIQKQQQVKLAPAKKRTGFNSSMKQ